MDLIDRLREFACAGFPIADLAADRIEELEREIAAAREDAERYRWLRDKPIGDQLDKAIAAWWNSADEFDAAIDAALKG